MDVVADWDDDEFEQESLRDRLAFRRRSARHRVGRALRALHLTRLADSRSSYDLAHRVHPPQVTEINVSCLDPVEAAEAVQRGSWRAANPEDGRCDER